MNLLNTVLYAINKSDVIQSLHIFWKGMLAVLIVLTIVFAATIILNKLSLRSENRKNNTTAENTENETDRKED